MDVLLIVIQSYELIWGPLEDVEKMNCHQNLYDLKAFHWAGRIEKPSRRVTSLHRLITEFAGVVFLESSYRGWSDIHAYLDRSKYGSKIWL
jgi:hypothetical protein